MDGMGPGSGGGSTRLRDYQYAEVHFDPEPGYEFVFDGLRGKEELGRPFIYEIDLSTGKKRTDVQKLVGSSATVQMERSKDEFEHSGDSGDRAYYVNGIVTRIVDAGLSRGASRYRFEIRPWFWLLSRTVDHRIFRGKSPFQIMNTVFGERGFSGSVEDKRQAGSGDVVLDYCVQYGESEFDFITRLMETYGIYYYFTHEDHKHTLVLADDPNSHVLLPKPLPYKGEQSDVRTVDDRIFNWMTDQTLETGKYTVQSYNFETPSADLEGNASKPAQHAYGDYDRFEYPSPHDDAGTAQKLSDVRMQALAANRVVYRALSNCRKLRPGAKFKLTGHPDQAMNKEHMITYSEFELTIGEGRSTYQAEGQTFDTYRTAFRAVPGDTHFRLHRETERPRIRGSQVAKVVGPAGEEIHTDKYGRVKVRFPWDRGSTSDEERTCWIRVQQSVAGAGWGSLFIPRVGQEVSVVFDEGDPDRPMVAGVVHNANQQVGYSLPANKTVTGFRSNSSPGGGGYNELSFDDKKGSELVTFQAQKDFKKTVLHDETVTIKNDTSTTVEEGNHSLKVSAGKSGTEAAVSITLKVGGSTVTVDTSSIKLEVGGSSVVVDAGGVTIKGGSVTITGGSVSIN